MTRCARRIIKAICTVAITAVICIPQHASAQSQTIRLRGHGDVDHDIYLRAVLAADQYLLITRDTVITRGDTVRVRVLVVGATLRLDGTLMQDLISVGGNVFVRPSATIVGETHNIAGGLYSSQLAHMNPVIENSPNAPYEVVPTATSIDIVGTEHASAFELKGIKGLSIPTYDRVNGVTLRAAADINLPRVGRAVPALRGWGTYYSQRGDLGGGGEIAVVRGRTEFDAGGERTTLTNERWIRGDLSNSLAMLLQGKDYRNYYAADRAYVRLFRTLEKTARTTTASLTAQVENASSLRAGMPWSITGPDSLRPNDYGVTPEGVTRLPHGRITSGIATLDTKWQRPTFIASVGGLAEVATTGLSGDASFARYVLTGDVAMAALRDQSLEVKWHFQGPLPGTDTLPYQRWSYVGGSGTLQTFQVAQFPGDRVAFVETKYTIPLPHRLALPLLGRPGIDLLHAVGMAWTKDQPHRFEQNVGVQLGYRVAYLRFVTDPRNFGDRVKTTIGLTFPRAAFPWETAADTAK